ncbi:MAG: pyrroline-5-carboxylate reductase [bacterium]
MIVTIIGLGNMGLALAEGLINSMTFSKKDIKGIEMSANRARFVAEKTGIQVQGDYKIIGSSDVLVLAVKPQNMKNLLQEIKTLIKNQLIISIAAGISSDFLKKGLGEKKIVRTMPNTPALVSKGITGVYCTEKVTEKDKELVEKILKAVGEVIFVDKEDDIDKITALSGSGPAYVYYFMEALEDAGVYAGLSRDRARRLILETFLGSVFLMKETGKTPTELREMVTSPGGTTINALYCLEKNGVKGALYEAVMSAYKRAKELEGN